MSLSYNTQDVNVAAIERRNRAFFRRYPPALQWRIYGLKAEAAYRLLLTPSLETKDSYRCCDVAVWLSARLYMRGVMEDGPGVRHDDVIYLGLRRDLRRHPALAAAVVRTVVAYLEGYLDQLDGRFKLPKRLKRRLTCAV